jgi:hypothetical protein
VNAVPPQGPDCDSGEEAGGCETDAVWKDEIERLGERVRALVAGGVNGYLAPPCAERDGGDSDVS